MTDLRIQCFVLDAVDPHLVADFWQGALGWRRTYEADDEVELEPTADGPQAGVAPDLLILRVPEGKTGRIAGTSTCGPLIKAPKSRGSKPWVRVASTWGRATRCRGL